MGCEGVQGSVKTVLYCGEGLGSGLEFFGLAGVGYYTVLWVGWAPRRSENGGGLVADGGISGRRQGFGGVFEAGRVNRTALSECGKVSVRGGYYAIGGVQLGFFG